MHLHAEQDKTPFSEKFIAIQWACQTGDICPWNELDHSLTLQLGHLAMSKPSLEKLSMIKIWFLFIEEPVS